MYERFFDCHPNYEIVEVPSTSMISKYEGILPEDLLNFWKTFGFGSFINGYLKFIAPDLLQQFLLSSYSPFREPSTVFAVTAMADLLIWEKDCVKQINFRTGKGRVASTNFTIFLNTRLSSWTNLEQSMDARQFLPALERLGECGFDECYAYVPALALGGPEKVENLQKVKLREHLMILSGLVGLIE